MAYNNTEDTVLMGLLTNASVRKASKDIGISESTIYKYLQDEKFKKRYNDARLEMLEQSKNYLQSQTEKAIRTMVGVMEDEDSSGQVKFNASDMLLRNHFKFTEQVEILRRLDELEKMQGEK